MALDRRDRSHVQSVERALRIIDVLAAENHDMSLTEVSNALEWPKSTVHGLITTLRDFSFVEQSPLTGKYSLGVKLFELGNIVARGWNIREVALPFMRRLSETTGETAHLAAEDNGDVLYIEKIDSARAFRIVSEIGARLPIHCTGLGKAILAHKTPAEIRRIFLRNDLRAMTPNSITSLEKLEKELERIRKDGFAVDNGEVMEGLRCVAAPIRDKNGNVNYAVSVSGVLGNMYGARFDKIVETLKKTAEDIMFGMGYRGFNK
ncbi:MAG: IclR family transcriptional regulator [Clostridiales bacterium]|nr:IclR family transcriptional regulator [Clostridiales bacterium]